MSDLESLRTENDALRKKITKMERYIEELEAFLKDEAAVYETEAAEAPITEIRTFSRGKETAFHYVLDILQKLKPKDTVLRREDAQDLYYEKEVKVGNTLSFFYSPDGETAAAFKELLKERASDSPESIVEMLRYYLKQMPEDLNCAINITFVP
ncbi:MAG: hypothetical protein GY765_28285 [bacterium]|nr:hypothetical protein [bacterium]